MSSKYDKIIKNFVQTIRESDKRGTSPYDTTAEVLRVDGDTAWVHIAGGVDETPVKKTIDCKPGDVVQLRVGGGRAWITGNATAPPTDDTKANKANETALSANKKAVTAYKTAEAEARDRRLIIREVAAGIEVGFENGGFKALINGEGSFDVINAAGNTVARFGTDVTLDSLEDSSGNRMLTTFDSEGMTLRHIKTGSNPYDLSTRITKKGIDATNSLFDFELSQGVTGVFGTPLWVGYQIPKGESPYIPDDLPTEATVLGTWTGAGFVTTGSKEVQFTLPLTTPIRTMEDEVLFYCSQFELTVRQNGKYLVGSADGGADLAQSTKITLEVDDSGINVVYTASSAISGATNNDACGIVLDYYIYIYGYEL